MSTDAAANVAVVAIAVNKANQGEGENHAGATGQLE